MFESSSKVQKASVLILPSKISWTKNEKPSKTSKKLIFNSLLIFLALHGLCLANQRPYHTFLKFLAVFYHILWLIGAIGTMSCLIQLPSSFYTFSAVVKVVTLCKWWILFRTRIRIYYFIRALDRLHIQLIGQSPSFHKTLKIALFILVLFIFGPGINNVYNTITKDTVVANCFHVHIPLPNKAARAVAYFLIQTNHQLINWSLSYLVNLLIIFCCLELGQLIDALAKNANRNFDETLLGIHQQLFDTILMMEDCLSLTCFFVLIRLYMEFFRIFSLLFNFVRGKSQSVSVFNASMYSVITGALFVFMIFAADNVQKRFNSLQRSLVKKSVQRELSQGKSLSGFQSLVWGESIVLTGWGIFELKKKLLLSTLASLITYGVLLQQLQQ
ncbi:uncharacterized protein NPIL_308121 [Nephila pilipes]|uniref:Gustatory receptor n=1 Tax=Nephila pilipes TaxID=299642 RepID=A0A8X6MYZ7_NEPPI|nr:uncharacterized protein NPIL_308121 [Nephila pilipes]